MAGQKKADPVKEAEQAQPSDPTRCGGYVLTDNGWALEPVEQEQDED